MSTLFVVVDAPEKAAKLASDVDAVQSPPIPRWDKTHIYPGGQPGPDTWTEHLDSMREHPKDALYAYPDYPGVTSPVTVDGKQVAAKVALPDKAQVKALDATWAAVAEAKPIDDEKPIEDAGGEVVLKK